jgi:hypothetical protein
MKLWMSSAKRKESPPLRMVFCKINPTNKYPSNKWNSSRHFIRRRV